MTRFQIRRPSHTWAGLRSFVPDGDMVIGWDNHVPGFFWLAGQGGYGIQSAAGASLLARQLLRGEPLAEELVREGVGSGRALACAFALKCPEPREGGSAPQAKVLTLVPSVPLVASCGLGHGLLHGVQQGGGRDGLHVQRLFQHHHVQRVRGFGTGQVGGGADDAVGEGDVHGDSLG